MTVMDEVARIVREVFDAPDADVQAGTTANDVDGWDSLSHVNLIVAVEAHYGFRFRPAEILSLRNVGDLAAVVEKKLQERDR